MIFNYFAADNVRRAAVTDFYDVGHLRGTTIAYTVAAEGGPENPGRFLSQSIHSERETRQYSWNAVWVNAMNQREDSDRVWVEYERGVLDACRETKSRLYPPLHRVRDAISDVGGDGGCGVINGSYVGPSSVGREPTAGPSTVGREPTAGPQDNGLGRGYE